jgi:hypothetical protein
LAALHVAALIAARLRMLPKAAFMASIMCSLLAPVPLFFLVPRLSTVRKKVICCSMLAVPMILPVILIAFWLYVLVFIAPNTY